MTAMHGNDHRVDAPAARDIERFTQGVGVQRVEAAIAGGVNTRALRGREDSAHGDHGTMVTGPLQRLITGAALRAPPRQVNFWTERT